MLSTPTMVRIQRCRRFDKSWILPSSCHDACRPQRYRPSLNVTRMLSSVSASSSTLPLHTSDTSTLPSRANFVIVGGGIIGTSVAYHLGKLGVENVILLEAHQLTSGTTWHAAGLMNAFGSLSSTSTWMRRYTQDLYSNVLPKQTGLETGWKRTGFIELAADEDRLEQFRRTAAFNRYCGVEVHEITPDEVKEKFPLCEVSDILAGFWVPNDGRANPTDATIALAKGARQQGVRIYERTPVRSVTKKDNHVGPPSVTGVVLESGETIEANVVVNCAGMWARQFAQACGVKTVPNQAAEHYYLITEDITDLDTSWPVVEDSSRYIYIRPEGLGLMLGFFEEDGAAWNTRHVPQDFSFGQLEPDWDRMAPYIEKALVRVPSLQNVGIKTLFCGPESFTPDNYPIVGEAPQLRNYYIAAGLNSLGILTGGGVGYLLAHWIRGGHAPDNLDVTAINADRFDDIQSNPAYRRERVGEALGNTYKVHFPDHQLKSCRNIKQSPLHESLQKANAYFKCVSGWESPAWYAPAGTQPVVTQESFGRENWFPYWQAEHQACRERVALFDMSFMSKHLVQGKDAGAFLNRLSTAQVDGDCSMTTYTQWLNERGYMEADLTITKLQDDQFLVVATDTMHHHVYNHMIHRIRNDENVYITNVTGQYAQINLQGPRSRELLQSLTSHDMNEFAFRQATEIDVGKGKALCIRITYVGELGYELFVPSELARRVYSDICAEGEAFGLQHAGLKALGSLRMVSTMG
jgi:glycine/D-amino acid oxidase-like deaminating enzyme/sarcosine oxidase gamma subunit